MHGGRVPLPQGALPQKGASAIRSRHPRFRSPLPQGEGEGEGITHWPPRSPLARMGWTKTWRSSKPSISSPHPNSLREREPLSRRGGPVGAKPPQGESRVRGSDKFPPRQFMGKAAAPGHQDGQPRRRAAGRQSERACTRGCAADRGGKSCGCRVPAYERQGCEPHCRGATGRDSTWRLRACVSELHWGSSRLSGDRGHMRR